MANPLDIPTVAKVNPLSTTTGAVATPAPAKVAKPFAATGAGIATNTILGIPHAALSVGAGIARGLVGDTIGLGRTFENVVAPGSAPESAQLPENLRPIFGDQTIKTIPKQFQDTKTAIQNSTVAKKIGVDKFAAPIAFGSVLGNNILDFAPLGGSEDAAVKALAKETDVGAIVESLKKMGVHEDVADKFAPHIAETNSPKEVKTLLKTVKGVQMLKHTAEARESLPDLTYEPTDEESMNMSAKTQAPLAEEGVDENALNEFNKSAPEAIDESKANIPTHLEPLADRAREAGSPEAFKQEVTNLQDKYLKGEPLTAADQDLLKGLRDAKADHIGTADEFYQRATNPKIDAIPKEFQSLAQKSTEFATPEEFEQSLVNNYKADALKQGIDYKDQPYPYLLAKAKEQLGMPSRAEDPNFIDNLYKNAKQMSDNTVSDLEKEETQPSVSENSIGPNIATPSGNIGKMDPTIEEQFARRATGTPGNTIQALAKEPDAKSWQSLVRGFSRNLPKQEKAHLLDYMGTPEFVLEKLGLQKGAEMLQDAKDLYHSTLKEEIAKVIDWQKQVKGTPDASRRIFKYLDGRAKEVRHEMTDTEYRVANEIKSYLKDWAKRLNLPEDHQISNYITHIFEKGEITLNDKTDPFADPDLATIMEAQPAKSVYNPFLEKRVNKQGYREDVFAALDAYTKRASRKEAMDPALEKVAAEAKSLEGDAYEYVAALTHNVNMRPTKIDGLIDNLITKFSGTKFTDRPTAYLTNKFRNLFYRGSLGLNLASALRNLSQGANTYAKLGEKYTLVGYTKVMANLATRNMGELYEHGILDEAIVQDRRIGVYKNLLQRLDPVLYKMFDTAEKVNRGAAFWGAKARAIDKGLSEEQAVKYAKRMVRETQFSFSAVDSAVALGGDAVKTALQLQNYNIKQIEFFARMLQNKEYAGLARWTVASLAFVYSIGRAFGMTPAQLIPGVGIGGGSGSPLLNLVDGLTHLGDSSAQKRASAQQEIVNTGIQAIPGGSQIKKTVQGLQAYNAGKDVTAAGSTRYKIPHDTQHLIQAALFGKSALPEAQSYYKKLDNPKKSSTKNPLSV